MNRKQRVVHVVVLVVIGVCLLAVPAPAQDCPELVGRLPGIGSVVAVAVSGDYAYVVSSDYPLNSSFTLSFTNKKFSSICNMFLIKKS